MAGRCRETVAILITVNFVVITKGSGRIAEVAARFHLDAMPGKQMAIDADLSAGLIDEKATKERRKALEDESGFFGAMDGASTPSGNTGCKAPGGRNGCLGALRSRDGISRVWHGQPYRAFRLSWPLRPRYRTRPAFQGAGTDFGLHRRRAESRMHCRERRTVSCGEATGGGPRRLLSAFTQGQTDPWPNEFPSMSHL